ncbi:hemicentin-1-like [Dreissena polymorpha]|uniref:hemicentin-1-like n=1 Tax=Dreissena polymorpha TaxID=45954 RepID=UPI002265659B|nr:hemicentin-1-like [Dreissena polymorpha]
MCLLVFSYRKMWLKFGLTILTAVTIIVLVKYVTLTPELPQIVVLPNVEISFMRCESSVGRPAPSITWYLDNRTPSDFSDDVNLTGYSRSLSVSDVTTSSLTLTPTSKHNGARIYCNVSNEYGQIMSNRTLQINVLIYPTKPTIMHNTVLLPSSISAIQNSTMTLECHSSGNPEPNVSWTLFNGSTISSSVVLFNVATSKTQEQIVCRATSLLDPTNGSRVTVENTTTTTLNILYPPSSPSCQIGSVTIQSNGIRAVVNKPFTMTCTSRSNPPPSRYIWALPYGTKQTGAQLLIQRMQPSDNNRYTLEVVNEMNATFERDVVYGNFTESYTFELLYPVTNLSIYHRGQSDQHIDSRTISVIGSREVSFRCNAFSNPVPRYVWKLSGAIVANGSYWKTTFVNNTSIVCIATNTLDPTGNEIMDTFSSLNVSIHVLYAPERPKLTFQTCATYSQTNHLKVIRGHSVSGRCTSKSEPGSKFYWTPINTGNGDGFLITNVSRYHIGNYTCIVNTEMNTTFGGNINGTNQSSFYLDVLAPAEALFIGNFTVLLNTTLSVTCPYTPGNPEETRFTWFHSNTSAIGSHQNLSLSNVQLAGEGYYKCRVNNTMDPTGCAAKEGYDETTFFVDVQYPAKISRFYADGSNFASSLTINDSQTVTLLCQADSDPLAKLELVNITKGDERLLMDAHTNTISAHLSNARCEYDMGIYQCKGKNIHNAFQQVRNLEIRITCSPRPSPFSPPIATAYRRRNASAILTFTFVAYPLPSDVSAYVWRKKVDDEWVLLQNNSRFRIRISNDGLQTNLSIFHLENDDFTNYSVRVNNHFGSTEQTFVIRENEQPSVPQQLLVVDAMVTQSSIAVQWTPGFNGGEDQWFVIGYKKAADESWTYINVSSTVTQLNIGDLVAGTKYEVKMYAENIIGKSDDTTVLSATTQPVISDNGSSPSVGAAVGGSVAGTLVAVILAVLWKYRKAFKRKPGEAAHYDDLFNRQADVPSSNTSSEYEAYRVEAQQTNQYETLAETSFHEYPVLSPGGKHDYSVMNRVNQVTDTDRAIVNQENAYVNLSFSET